MEAEAVQGTGVIDQIKQGQALIDAGKASLKAEIAEATERLKALTNLYAAVEPASKQKRKYTKKATNGHAAPQTFAQKALEKLGSEFSVDDARKVFKGAMGVSLAQLIRGGRVKKTKDGYKKL